MTGLKNRYSFWIVCVGIFAVAIFSRLYLLGIRPVHHDEGMLSYFAWQLAEMKNYSYSPQIHGPILFYVQAVLFALFETSNFVVRLGPAIFGIILVAIPLSLYKAIGKPRATAISLLILVSPMFLYFSRFLVHTSLVVVFYLGFIYFLRSFVVSPKPIPLYLASIFLALAFGVSEVTYILVAAIFASAAVSTLILGRKSFKYYKNIGQYFKENSPDIVSAILLFVLVWIAIYSVGFTNVASLKTSIPNPFAKDTSLGFWLSQHDVRLGGQPWFYYLLLALSYEPIILLGSLFGLVDSIIKKNPFYLFVAWWAVFMLAIFSWAGEKFPWLFLPPLLPLTVLTGYYIGTNWKNFKVLSKIFWVAMAIISLFISIRLNYINHTETREMAVYVQTPLSFQKVIDKIEKDCKDSPDKNCVLIDQKISWPLSWTFKDYSTLIYSENFTPQPSTKYIFMDVASISSMNAAKDWNSQQVQLREWWVPESCHKITCMPKYFEYFITRKVWNEKGGFDTTLLTPVKNGG